MDCGMGGGWDAAALSGVPQFWQNAPLTEAPQLVQKAMIITIYARGTAGAMAGGCTTWKS